MCNAAIYSNETRQVRLPPSTVAMYDKSVEFWMLLRRNLEQAAKICGNSGICKGDRCRNGHVCSPVSEARLPVGPSTSICPTKYLYISDQVPLYVRPSTSICPTEYLYLSDQVSLFVRPSTSICPIKYLSMSDQVPLFVRPSSSIFPTKYF